MAAGPGDGRRLDVRGSMNVPSFAGQLINLESTDDITSANDLLQLKTGTTSSDNMQFIECERGNDFKFRVWGDGDVTADGTLTGGGADYAELIKVSTGADSVEAGDVMVIDLLNPTSFVRSFEPRSTLVAGIFSTKPGVLGSEHDWDQVTRDLYPDAQDESDEGLSIKPLALARELDEIPLAIVGIVPCKVSAENGPIRPGDLLVTSSIPGHAMRDENPRPGTIVGKALDEHWAGTGVIKVLVTLR